MNEINTGRPVFPLADSCCEYGNTNRSDANGMTLRDYFAAKATEEDVAEYIWKGYLEDFVTSDSSGHKRVVQRQAMYTREQAKYRYADAMLKERSK